MGFLGKLILIGALCGYSYLLYTDVSLASTFDKQYKAFLDTPCIKESIPKHLIALVPTLLARQIVCGLIGSSILLFICRIFAIFPIFGVLLHIAIVNNPMVAKSEQEQIELLKMVAILGGLLVVATNCGRKCNKPKVGKVKAD